MHLSCIKPPNLGRAQLVSQQGLRPFGPAQQTAGPLLMPPPTDPLPEQGPKGARDSTRRGLLGTAPGQGIGLLETASRLIWIWRGQTWWIFGSWGDP